MKKVLFLISLLSLTLLTASCADNNTQINSPTNTPISTVTPTTEITADSSINPSVTTTPPTTTQLPASPSPSPVHSHPHSNPPDPSDSPLRPEHTTLIIADINQELSAKLVYQNLSVSNPFLAFSIYSDHDSLELKYNNPAYIFSPIDASSDKNFLELRFIPGTDSEDIKPRFADDYIDYTDIEFNTQSVGVDNMYCRRITAYNNEQFVEIYLIDVTGGIVTVVISLDNSSDNLYTPRFFAMLDTLILHD